MHLPAFTTITHAFPLRIISFPPHYPAHTPLHAPTRAITTACIQPPSSTSSTPSTPSTPPSSSSSIPSSSSSSTPPSPTSPSTDDQHRLADRKALDSLTHLAKSDLTEISNDVKSSLDAIREASEMHGTRLLSEETTALLEKFEAQKLELLQNVATERGVITEQLEKIEQISNTINSSSLSSSSPTSSATKFLTACTALFALAAFFFACEGFLNADSDALRNAAIDAIVAAISGYFLTAKTN